MADQLATPQELATFLQLDYDSLGEALQDTMTMLVELATAKVQRMAGGQRIVDATSTAVIDVTDPCDLYLPLPQWPVISVASVSLDGMTLTLGMDVFLRRQMLWRSAGWMNRWSPPSQATVTWRHGYVAGSQWLELGRAHALSLARMGWGNPSGVTSEAIDDYRVTYAEADVRMQPTEHMQAAIADAYGTSAYVTLARN